MKRFDNVSLFASVGANSEKLIKGAEDYAMHKINEMTGVKTYSVIETTETGEPINLAGKSVQLNDMAVCEIEARTGLKRDTMYGNLKDYANNPTVSQMAMVVQKVMVDTMTPYFINATGLNMLAKMNYVGYGQPMEFELKTENLYSVSEMDRRSRNTKRQESKKKNFTLTPKMYGLSTFATLPDVIQGIDSIAEDSAKVAMSIAKKIYTLVLKEFVNKATAFTDTKWTMTNLTEKGLLGKLANLTAYNGEKPVIFGDVVALKDLLPENASVRILLSDEYNTTLGYMADYNGYKVVAFDRVRDDSEVAGVLGLPEDAIYGICMSSKLVQVGVGATHIVTDDMRAQYNLSGDTTLSKELAVQLVTKKKLVKVQPI